MLNYTVRQSDIELMQHATPRRSSSKRQDENGRRLEDLEAVSLEELKRGISPWDAGQGQNAKGTSADEYLAYCLVSEAMLELAFCQDVSSQDGQLVSHQSELHREKCELSFASQLGCLCPLEKLVDSWQLDGFG